MDSRDLSICESIMHSLFTSHVDEGITPAREWTAEDDRNFVSLRRKGLAWADISKHLNRSIKACQQRLYAKPLYHTRRQFTTVEDEMIVSEVTQYMNAGKRPSWKAIGSLINRAPSAVRGRWEEILNPLLEKKPCTYEEDVKISRAVLMGKEYRGPSSLQR